jgi:hypothetical protein
VKDTSDILDLCIAWPPSLAEFALLHLSHPRIIAPEPHLSALQLGSQPFSISFGFETPSHARNSTQEVRKKEGSMAPEASELCSASEHHLGNMNTGSGSAAWCWQEPSGEILYTQQVLQLLKYIDDSKFIDFKSIWSTPSPMAKLGVWWGGLVFGVLHSVA